MLEALKKSPVFTTCSCCGFIYLPMSKRTLTSCPKCEPISNKMFVDADEEYLNSEVREYEVVSHEMIDYSEPRLIA